MKKDPLERNGIKRLEVMKLFIHNVLCGLYKLQDTFIMEKVLISCKLLFNRYNLQYNIKYIIQNYKIC
jgi:hypothetical protein